MATSPRLLVVDDDPDVCRAYYRVLHQNGFEVVAVEEGRQALEMVQARAFDAIFTDITLPGMNGMAVLRAVRELDLDVPVIIMTGKPDAASAAQAMEFGALRYLFKPIDPELLARTAKEAVRMHEVAKLKRDALNHLGVSLPVGDRAGLEVSFERALTSLWMAYQPIVAWGRLEVIGYEALLRTKETTMPNPGALLRAAELLGRLEELGDSIRHHVAGTLDANPDVELVFVNLHPRDLTDDALYEEDAPLATHARRIVLEITERSALDRIPDLSDRIRVLRALGYRIALDDLGAGFAGLASFARLSPDVVKIDMSLVRNVQHQPIQARLIQSVAALCRDLGVQVIAEGVETIEERDTLVGLGCDLLQGYLFSVPKAPFPEVVFTE